MNKILLDKVCEELGKPYLSYVYVSPHISPEALKIFYYDLCLSLDRIARGENTNLPVNANIDGLPDFIAHELSDRWVKALYKLGFMAGDSCDDSAVILIHPDGYEIICDEGEYQEFYNELHSKLSILQYS